MATKIFRLDKTTRRFNFSHQLDTIGWMVNHRQVMNNVKVGAIFICISFNAEKYNKLLSHSESLPFLSIILPGTIVNQANPNNHDELFFVYRAESAGSLLELLNIKEVAYTRYYFSMNNKIQEIISDIREQLHNLHNIGAADILDILAIRLFSELLILAENPSAHKGEIDLRICEISAKLKEGEKLPQLIKQYGFSRRQFYLKWNNSFAITPIQYQQQAKLEKAARLLTHTTLSASEIAAICKFENLVYFYRCFKKYYKTTPADYRNAAFEEPAGLPENTLYAFRNEIL